MSGSGGTDSGAGGAAGADAGADASLDVAGDGADAGADASLDVAGDGADAGADASLDAAGDGADAGADASLDVAGDGADAGRQCVLGAQRCAGNVPETCDGAGIWQTGSTCSGATPDCHDGRCEPATPASCALLPETCGPNSNGYCCASHAVTGGSFSRSYDGVAPFNDPSYTATVSDFRLDDYEVTVGRFRAFVSSGAGTQANPPAAGAGANPAISGSGWNAAWDSDLASDTTTLEGDLHCDSQYATWTDSPGANEARPINCITWYEAFAFCAWDAARLPTEAEWNYAAAGGSEQRVYPWSAPPTSTVIAPTFASYWVDASQQCMGDGAPGCTLADLIPVGSKPDGAGRFGQFDLAGNVWEWTLDVYKNPYAQNPCDDCSELSGGTNRVIRGGSFFGNATSVLTATRSPGTPTSRFYTVGTRCAR